MERILTKHVLFEYLAGRANPLERQLVDDWIEQPQNSETFYRWLLEFESKYPQFSPGYDEGLVKVQHRLDSDIDIDRYDRLPAQRCSSSWLQKYRNRYLFIAASMSLIASCVCWCSEGIILPNISNGIWPNFRHLSRRRK